MIVDTSALVAVLRAEEGADAIIRALFSERGFIPAPVIFEFHRVTSERFNEPSRPALDLLSQVLAQDVGIIALTDAECDHAADLNQRLGSGNERGGKLKVAKRARDLALNQRDQVVVARACDHDRADPRNVDPARAVDRQFEVGLD